MPHAVSIQLERRPLLSTGGRAPAELSSNPSVPQAPHGSDTDALVEPSLLAVQRQIRVRQRQLDVVGMEVALTVAVVASVVLVVALYQRLAIPAIAYFPSAAAAFVLHACIAAVDGFSATSACTYCARVAVGLFAQVVLSVGVITCSGACVTHFLCFYRRVDPRRGPEGAIRVCSHAWIDGAMFPMGAVCFMYTALVLLSAINLRTQVYLPPELRRQTPTESSDDGVGHKKIDFENDKY